LCAAADALGAEGTIVSRSSIWKTAAIGPIQPDYLNAVIVIETVLGPRPLLVRCLAVEQVAGRERRTRWGPRVIALDLLLYGDAEIDGEGIRVPHPRMADRRFVLAPLAEAWPGVSIPNHGLVEDLVAAVADQEAALTTLQW